MKKILLFSLISIFCWSCFEAEEDLSMDLLQGTWNGLSYKVGDELQDNASAWQFQLGMDSTYQLKFGPQEQTGVYRVAGNKLYTTPKGQAEISVEVQHLTQDSMIVKMNRSGVIEILTFGKSF